MGTRQREQDHYLKINSLPLRLSKLEIIETPQVSSTRMKCWPARWSQSINRRSLELPSASGYNLEETGEKGPDLTLPNCHKHWHGDLSLLSRRGNCDPKGPGDWLQAYLPLGGRNRIYVTSFGSEHLVLHHSMKFPLQSNLLSDRAGWTKDKTQPETLGSEARR